MTTRHRPLKVRDLWNDDAPNYVTIVTTTGRTVYGALYGLTEGDRYHRAEVLVEDRPGHEPTHITTDRIRTVWAGKVTR